MVAWLKPYIRPRLLLILLLGFSSGLPLMLTFSTLSTWLADMGVDKGEIGLFALVGIAYSFNFLWSPVVDHVRLPLLHRMGRRRSWILGMQMVLCLAIAAMALTNPLQAPLLTALAALVVAFASATQDIAIDAYRTEILPREDYGYGAAMGVFGYRVGMLISGAGALFIAEYVSWQAAYMAMALTLPLCMMVVCFAPEPPLPQMDEPDEPELQQRLLHKLREAVVEPFRNFMLRKGWWLLLLFVLCSKLPDAFAGFMIQPFLLETGFSKADIAEIGKIYGFIATTLGTFVGGYLIRKTGIWKTLWIAIPFQMAANLIYILQAQAGADTDFLILTITADNLSSGIVISAIIAFMMSLCNLHYTATQYALLSSLAGFGRTVLSSGSGKVAEVFGWETFFIISGSLGIPALIALLLMPRFVDMKSLETHHKQQVG